MEGIGYIHMIYELDRNLTADFYFQKTHVYSISKSDYKKAEPDRFRKRAFQGITIPGQKISKYGYLAIDVTVDLKSYDSLNEGSAIIRPQLLAIQGILSFLTGMVLIPSNSFTQHALQVPKHIEKGVHKNKLRVEKYDRSADLDKIFIKIIDSPKKLQTLYYSLFERWRKALYLEIESEDNLIYSDESVLAYIHILEVLSDEFKANLEVNIKAGRKQLTNELVALCKQDAIPGNTKVDKLINRINSLQVSLKSKILQMLEDLELNNTRTVAIVTRFIEHRNAIAHGRNDIYQDYLVFPLPPFFSFIKDIDEKIFLIKLLSECVVSKYFELSNWQDAVKALTSIETTPLASVKDFLEKETFLTISANDFFIGSIDGITPDTLSFYFVRKKLEMRDLQAAIAPFLNFTQLTETLCNYLFYVAVPLSDSQDKYVAEKAIEIIKTTHSNRWGLYSNIRDVIKYYEYFGIKLVWFEEWLTRRSAI